MKFGFHSSAALLFKYFHLTDALKKHDARFDVRRNTTVMQSYAVLKDHFIEAASSLQPSGHAGHTFQEAVGQHVLLRYDTRAFQANHPDAGDLPTNLWGPIDTTPFVDCAFHIYAIDAAGRVIIEAKPLSPAELFERAKGNRVTHAHLVKDRGLAVICAGEAVFVRGAPASYAIINNRSGHFLPRQRNLAAAIESFSRALRVQAANIFELCVARE